jgi:ABC-type multidrug transport system fused ATPase/permease subunit
VDYKVPIDGVDLKEFQLRCIRRKIGLVSQEPVLDEEIRYASKYREKYAPGQYYFLSYEFAIT